MILWEPCIYSINTVTAVPAKLTKLGFLMVHPIQGTVQEVQNVLSLGLNKSFLQQAMKARSASKPREWRKPEVTHLHSINPVNTDRSHTDVAMVDGLILQREEVATCWAHWSSSGLHEVCITWYSLIAH